MADNEEKEELLAGMVDNADGTHTPILARDVEKAIAAIGASEKLIPDNVLHITPILRNLCSLEIDLGPLGDFAPNTMLPIEADGSVAITQGKFIVGFEEGEPPVEADLFLVGDGRLAYSGETEPNYECSSVTLSIEDENGWHEATKEELGGIDPGSVWKATRPDGEAINLHTILSSLVLLRGIQAAYDNMAEEIQDAKKEDKKKLAETMFGSITEDKQPKKEKQHRNTTKAPDEIAVMNDAVTKAMFGRGEACIQPAAYFNQSMTRVNTGKGGYSNVMVQAPGNTAIDAPFSSYGLSDSDRYWLDAAYSLVKGGNTEFYGSDLLKMNNYKNPWAPSMRKTMNQALYAMMKMKSTLVTVDATNDRRGTKGAAGKIVNRSVGAKSVIECEIFIDEMNDGKNDFTVKLRPPEGSSDPIEAFALSNRAEADHQILKLSTGDSEFKTVKRIDGNEREMWRYVLRRIKEEAFRGTILVDTMFTELALDQQGKSDAAIAKKRTRMIDALRKMLEEKSDPHSPGRLIEGYKFVGADGKLATGMPAKITIRKLKASKDVAGK